MADHRNYIYRSHPWHGLPIGEEAPRRVNCYIEIVPTDTVKYELDKDTGILKVDRPHRYSSLCPCLYGLLPQTYAGDRVAELCMKKTGRNQLKGDRDPLDICVITEKVIVRGDILVQAHPIGGLSLLDGDEVDDKIIAVLAGDLIYGEIRDISDCPESLIERLCHYFLTYKDSPTDKKRRVELLYTYGREEVFELINQSLEDYKTLNTKK